MAAVFLCRADLSTLERNVTESVCMTVRPQMDVSGTWMTKRYQYLGLDILRVRSSTIHRHLSPSRAHCALTNTHTHTRSPCFHKGRTRMSLSLLSNFLLMGPQTISCFHLSYWFNLWPSHRFT